jgi:hypothetical protein
VFLMIVELIIPAMIVLWQAAVARTTREHR